MAEKQVNTDKKKLPSCLFRCINFGRTESSLSIQETESKEPDVSSQKSADSLLDQEGCPLKNSPSACGADSTTIILDVMSNEENEDHNNIFLLTGVAGDVVRLMRATFEAVHDDSVMSSSDTLQGECSCETYLFEGENQCQNKSGTSKKSVSVTKTGSDMNKKQSKHISRSTITKSRSCSSSNCTITRSSQKTPVQ